MITENTSREWIVARPPTENTPQEVEIARITASEVNKQLNLLFAKQYSLKHLRQGIPLTPVFARHLGQALIKAADLSEAAWK